MKHTRALGVISHLDSGLADIVALSLLLDGVDVFSCSIVGVGGGSDVALDLNITDPSIRFTQYVLGDEGQYAEAPLDDGCITCALRQGIVNFVYSRMLSDESMVGGTSWHFGEESDNQRREKETIILLPQGIELSHLMPGLTEEMDNLSVRVMGAAHLINVAAARGDLLSHIPLADRGMHLFAGDERCIAEVHQLNLGYADAIVAIGDDVGGAQELIEHLRPHDVLLFNGLEHEMLHELRAITHSPGNAIVRVHPATTQAWGGPREHGTWTLDLYSDKPFHPERLRDFVSSLCADGVYVRGCFWLPTRPDEICSWEGIGQVLSIGSAGKWSEFLTSTGEELTPRSHLIVTGVTSQEVAADIERSFAFMLIGDDEDLLAWVGRSDGFDDWLSVEN